MIERYVFDTEAIIAYLYDEPSGDVVAEYLTDVRNGATDGLLAETNAAEVLYLVARFEGIDDKPTADSLRTADRDLRALERWGLQLESADWRVAAEVKADGHISLADAHAVALAAETDATLVVGADDDFGDLPIEVDIIRFREKGV
ncbi:PIN domain-containing protein [Natronococcus sp. A-GB7]|uniref:PIN domain-containing protein n=1 Tax=Natronococcus sp. A-GB7 TaxID=3037649 RepID=UPI00241E237A|nr:PIN domain-containing protein [Natronococcus sp. A-GB7]MDG5818662.1 PIN domain-containing protein [Natronococcus sp. A-GB7]